MAEISRETSRTKTPLFCTLFCGLDHWSLFWPFPVISTFTIFTTCVLKSEDFSYIFSATIKGRSGCYVSLHCEEYGHMRTFKTQKKVIYRDRSREVELKIELENKQQCGESTQAHLIVIYW